MQERRRRHGKRGPLRRTHGHQAQASELLGLNRTTLRTRMRALGIVMDRVVTEPERPS